MMQKTGMGLFVAANFFLIAVLFLNDYQLEKQVVRDVLNEEQLEFGEEALQPMFGKLFTSKVRFINDFEDHLGQANRNIQEKYGISDQEIQQIIKASQEGEQVNYNLDRLKDIYNQDDEVEAYKAEQLSGYTNWLVDKEFSSINELEEALSQSISNLNRNIIQQRGFSDYLIDQIKLDATKKSGVGFVSDHHLLLFWLIIGAGLSGGLLYILPKLNLLPGIKNNHVFHSANKNRGWIGISIGILLILFYVVIYWYPAYVTEWLILVDPLSYWIKNQPASQWFFYGFLYTLAIAVMGIRMIIHYRHSKYHILRTISVIFFQVAFAFMIPEILLRLNQPSMDFKNIWPLDYDFFFDYNLSTLVSSGSLGMFMLVWGVALIVIGVPVITYFYGKRWYCSWVCGCGGLAETMGDPYRQLSDKTLKAWQVERWLVHGVLVFSVVMTIGVLYTYLTGSGSLAGINTYNLRSIYGFAIGAAFAGVIGVGFYPFMGNRVWCRFGCPLAAYLGLVQRFKSRFRITTNGGQCISCGNCSTYCEMGIDVRWYAQRGQNIVRSSCVGCGVCSSVCPRGVLNLENKDPKGRFGKPILLGNDSIKVVN